MVHRLFNMKDKNMASPLQTYMAKKKESKFKDSTELKKKLREQSGAAVTRDELGKTYDDLVKKKNAPKTREDLGKDYEGMKKPSKKLKPLGGGDDEKKKPSKKKKPDYLLEVYPD